MTDHHEEFVAGKIEEQLDILFQADDAVASPFPQPGQRLIQDLHTLSTYTLDKQADQVSLARVQQRLQQHSDRITTKRLNDGNTNTIHTTTIIEDDQQRNNDMKKLFAQRSKKPWLEALVAILALGLCISLLMAFLNIYPFNNVSHPNITPTATPSYNNLQKQVTPGATPAAGTATPTATPTAEPLPVVQTSCPANGTVRLAVMTPMATTSQRGILYTSNFAIAPSSPHAQIKRYDVTTGITTTLFTATSAGQTSGISSILISANGQWVTFVELQNGIDMLHLMRADGQELQTLYCSNQYINPVSWSPNQHYLILNDPSVYASPAHLTLIDLTTGAMREILKATKDITGLEVIGWAGNTGIYVRNDWIGGGITCHTHSLSFLSDVTKDVSQQASNLQHIPLSTDADLDQIWYSDQHCQDFSVSPDASQLLLDNYITPALGPAGPSVRPAIPAGPSTLSLRPMQGGNAQIINDAPTHTINSAGFITNSMVWFRIHNPTTNSGKNGLWVMHTDSTGLTCLMPEQPTDNVSYEDLSFTQDAQNFAVLTYTNQKEALTFGSLNGGTNTTFATPASKELLNLIGWAQF